MAEPKKKTEEPKGQSKPEEGKLFVALAYILSSTVIVPLFFYFIKKENGTQSERYHYLQAAVFGVVILVLSFTIILSIVGLAAWLYGIYIAYLFYIGKSDERPLKQYIGQYA
jgi:glucan phosphoethanolaminetransferase (alkaline phosphatase superfamily)